MYQERHGWERPGWFIPDEVAEVSKVTITNTGKALGNTPFITSGPFRGQKEKVPEILAAPSAAK